MIFVSLGTQKFEFNRLLIEIDRLIEEKIIEEKVFGQIGCSTYEPRNFSYKSFLSPEEYNTYINNCSMIITHGGTGSIISSIKKNKKVIACPRLKKNNEHVDNHQMEIVEKLSNRNLILGCSEVEDLEKKILESNKIELNMFESKSLYFNTELEIIIDNLLEF